MTGSAEYWGNHLGPVHHGGDTWAAKAPQGFKQGYYLQAVSSQICRQHTSTQEGLFIYTHACSLLLGPTELRSCKSITYEEYEQNSGYSGRPWCAAVPFTAPQFLHIFLSCSLLHLSLKESNLNIYCSIPVSAFNVSYFRTLKCQIIANRLNPTPPEKAERLQNTKKTYTQNGQGRLFFFS